MNPGKIGHGSILKSTRFFTPVTPFSARKSSTNWAEWIIGSLTYLINLKAPKVKADSTIGYQALAFQT